MNGNCNSIFLWFGKKSVLGCTIRLMNSQAEAKSDKNSVTTLNIDNWLRMLQDDEPPKSSWRPRKSTKSWDQLSVQKFTKVAQSRKKVHRVGKLVLPSLVAWRACYQIRDAPAEKRRESQVQKKLNENWDAISLVFLSAVLTENFSSFRSALHNFKPYCAFKRMELATPTKQGWSAKLGTTAVLLLESLRSPRIEHLRSITTSHKKWQKIQYYAENFVFFVVQGFTDSFFMLFFTWRLPHRYRRIMKNIMCPATIRSENMSGQAQGDLLQTQSQDGEQARGNSFPPELLWRKVQQENNSHSLPWKTEIAKCRRARNYLDSLQETHRWSHTSSSKILEKW